jgi:hypothetical protein
VVAARPSSSGPEVRDDMWVHLSAGHEERSKAARLEASSCGGGGNPVGHHRRAGRLGRPRGRSPVGRGGAAGWKEKKEWATAGPKGRMG